MNLINIIKKLFIKKQFDDKVIDTNIALFNISNINLPSFKNLNEKDKNKVLKYKKELDLDNLEKIIKYNQNTSKKGENITNLFIKYLYELYEITNKYNKTIDELNDESINLAIKNIKLIVLKKELEELKYDACLKTIAINDINNNYKNRKHEFLELFSSAARIKRNMKLKSLNDLETRCKITIKTLEQQLIAMSNAINNNNTMINLINIYNNLTDKVKNIEYREKFYNKKLEYFIKINKYYLQNSLQNIDKLQCLLNDFCCDKEQEIFFLIAKIDLDIDKFTYSNKNYLIQQFRNGLEELENIHITKENKYSLLNQIEKIELIINMLHEFISETEREIVIPYFDKDLIYKNELRELYEIKFNVLTIDINEFGYSPITSDNSYEYEIYKSIISNKIRKINNGETVETKRFKEQGMYKKLINIFNKELISPNLSMELKTKIILNSGYLIGLILSFEKENGLDNFFKEHTLSKNYYKDWIKLYSNIILEDSLSLDSICTFIEYELETKEINRYPNIYKLYRLIKEVEKNNQENDIYKLPEGIKELNGYWGQMTSYSMSSYKYLILKIIREKAKDEKIIFPSSLRKITGDIFANTPLDSYNIKGVVLNEGLEIIGPEVFDKQNIKNVIIPPSVKEISNNSFNYYKIEVLEFINFKESKLLYNLLYNNNVPYRELFFYLFHCDIYFNIKPKFHKIYLIDENEKKYIIYKNELEFKSVISSNKGLPEVYWNDIPKIRSNFIRVIKQKTDFDFKDYQEEINNNKK